MFIDDDELKTERLNAGLLRLVWTSCDPECVRSISGDHRAGAVFEVGTSLSDALEEKPLVVEILSSSC